MLFLGWLLLCHRFGDSFFLAAARALEENLTRIIEEKEEKVDKLIKKWGFGPARYIPK